jgi:integrase/recombinase XerD
MQAQIEEYLRFVTVEKGYSTHTVTAYRNDLAQLMTYVRSEGLVSWQDVDRAAIQRYVQYLRQRGYASSTVGRKVAAVKSYFHFLVADGVLQDDPTSSVDSPQVDKHLPHPLSPEEVERLLTVVAGMDSPKGKRDRAILELMYATGMRASEIIQLEVGALDLEAGTVRCVGKGDKERILPVHAWIAARATWGGPVRQSSRAPFDSTRALANREGVCRCRRDRS